jgi:pyruvate-formate lyase-activating enzyme
MSLPCYYSIGGLNFKNGFVTSCPQQHEKMQILDDAWLPSEFYNNELFRKHRLEMMRGEWSFGCDMCEHVERDRSGKSMRQEQEADLTHYNPKTGEVDFAGLKTVEIRFSHSCNMACLHCSQVFSSGWMKKLKGYKPDDEDYKHELHQLTGRMHRATLDDDFTMQISTKRALEIAEDLNKNFPNLERIDFAGGEVLYQKQFLPTLEKLSEHPNAENIKIIFHSNFNADFDPEALSFLLKKFGYCNIMISVDAGPRLYPYFRQGDWNKLKENIEKFKAADNNHSDVNLVCTTGVYQLMEFEDIMRGFLSLECDYINCSIIYTPAYLNPSVLMLKNRSFVLNELERARNAVLMIDKERRNNILETKDMDNFVFDEVMNYGHWTDIFSALKAIEQVREYVLNHHAEHKHYTALEKYIAKSDTIWKQNFNDYVQSFKFEDGVLSHNV